MRIIDLVEFNRELLQRMNEAGIRLEDYKYCDLYCDYDIGAGKPAASAVG